ncbi:hypothetical protein PROFUN_11138 [Planoprotostelium fungivorum]|uniref:Uncharacterized protein n=1 Tax=Planoprotostelium fungivorum TaxID=1890364 RepID=A0A2P6NAS8_9EUKA|nr:hypothetical protein PROFUN_11138 [Planoprotostelium fungivorum]
MSLSRLAFIRPTLNRGVTSIKPRRNITTNEIRNSGVKTGAGVGASDVLTGNAPSSGFPSGEGNKTANNRLDLQQNTSSVGLDESTGTMPKAGEQEGAYPQKQSVTSVEGDKNDKSTFQPVDKAKQDNIDYGKKPAHAAKN